MGLCFDFFCFFFENSSVSVSIPGSFAAWGAWHSGLAGASPALPGTRHRQGGRVVGHPAAAHDHAMRCSSRGLGGTVLQAASFVSRALLLVMMVKSSRLESKQEGCAMALRNPFLSTPYCPSLAVINRASPGQLAGSWLHVSSPSPRRPGQRPTC